MIAKGIRNAKCGYGCSKTGTNGEKVTKFVWEETRVGKEMDQGGAGTISMGKWRKVWIDEDSHV